VEHRALFSGIQRERRYEAVAGEKQKREGGDNKAGPSSAPKDDKWARVDQLPVFIQNCKI
jgi:hypothetical protein